MKAGTNSPVAKPDSTSPAKADMVQPAHSSEAMVSVFFILTFSNGLTDGAGNCDSPPDIVDILAAGVEMRRAEFAEKVDCGILAEL